MKFMRTLFTTIFWGLLAWLVGFLIFALQVCSMREATINGQMVTTDAVVVLTGGSERLASGLELLKNHTAKKLLISGVYPHSTMDLLLRNQAVPKELRDCCVFLGHAADNTIGNAQETAAWMEHENFTSLRLVTANYHMPRSLLLFKTALPTTTILPHAVVPEGLSPADWWQRPQVVRLLAVEYTKYLIAWARIEAAVWMK